MADLEGIERITAHFTKSKYVVFSEILKYNEHKFLIKIVLDIQPNTSRLEINEEDELKQEASISVWNSITLKWNNIYNIPIKKTHAYELSRVQNHPTDASLVMEDRFHLVSIIMKMF